jgi:peptidoglycan/xylan/chitin deacetylase (PgdA/CDA1 family)
MNLFIIKLYLGRIISFFFGLFKIKNKNIFRILTYHSIGDDVPEDDNGLYNLSEDKFYKQMKYLYDNNYNVCSLNNIKKNCICITFDDGFLNNLIKALPILEKFKFDFTVFVSPDLIINNNNNLYMTTNDLINLSNYDNVIIGGHSYHHKRLGIMSTNQAEIEIYKCKNWLEKLLKKEIIHFSFPYGSYNNELIELLKKHNFHSSSTVKFGSNTLDSNFYELKRTDIFSYDSLSDFVSKVNGNWDWLHIMTSKHKK